MMRVIVFEDGEKWIAQGLERDICASASTLDDLFALFEMTVRLEKEEGGLERIDPAPESFFRLWDNSDIKLFSPRWKISAFLSSENRAT